MQIDHTALLAILGSIITVLFGLLCAILGWGGNKLIQKMDQLYDRMDSYVSGIHVRINGIDTRVTVLETRCRSRHDDPG